VKKIKLDQAQLLLPYPTVIVGIEVNGKPSFTTLGGITSACLLPPFVAISVNRVRYAMKGIRENMVFSVNIPSITLVKETDYCGMATGATRDKAKDCKFDIFYGEVDHAPFIEQCPINIGCNVEHILRLGSHYLVIGAIKETLVSDNCMTDNKPDMNKIDPIVLLLSPSITYQKIGAFLGPAFHIGREIRDVKDDPERHKPLKR
jgi:flavin reductase (DIM6/NTAB) family NADH-FMN oxidoreductase RutF